MRNMNNIELANHVKVGERWFDIDVRNIDRGKTGKAKPKHREVEIVALPTASSAGVMRVVKAPLAPHTIGKLRRFSYAKLIENYTPVSSVK